MRFHASSSSSVSRPGSTTAPRGRPAMVARSRAVAGIEPVEPAAITGALGCRGEAARLRRDQAVAPLRRLDGAALGEDRRPVSRATCRNSQRDLPILVEMVGHQPVEALPRHLARRHVVDQPREIVGERERRRRVAHDSGGSPAAAPAASAQAWTSRASRKRRSRPPSAGGRSRASAAASAGRHVGEHELVLVDVADRHDARQQRRLDPEHVEEGIAREPAGAPGRQEDRRRGKGQRIGRRQPVDEPAVAERAEERRQERRRRRNGEDARLHG